MYPAPIDEYVRAGRTVAGRARRSRPLRRGRCGLHRRAARALMQAVKARLGPVPRCLIGPPGRVLIAFPAFDVGAGRRPGSGPDDALCGDRPGTSGLSGALLAALRDAARAGRRPPGPANRGHHRRQPLLETTSPPACPPHCHRDWAPELEAGRRAGGGTRTPRGGRFRRRAPLEDGTGGETRFSPPSPSRPATGKCPASAIQEMGASSPMRIAGDRRLRRAGGGPTGRCASARVAVGGPWRTGTPRAPAPPEGPRWPGGPPPADGRRHRGGPWDAGRSRDRDPGGTSGADSGLSQSSSSARSAPRSQPRRFARAGRLRGGERIPAMSTTTIKVDDQRRGLRGGPWPVPHAAGGTSSASARR